MGYLKILRQKILDDAEEAERTANARRAGPGNATPAGGTGASTSSSSAPGGQQRQPKAPPPGANKPTTKPPPPQPGR
eukprot:6487609-Amphidinium_carterae.1